MNEFILNKRKYFELARKGLCGNAPRMWNSVKEARDSGYNGDICLRSYSKMNKTFYRNIEDLGYIHLSDGVFCESPGYRLFQGEFGFVDNYELYYGEAGNLTLREAMLSNKAKRVTGIKALELLKLRIGYDDYEAIMDLLHLYTVNGFAPVIEFSNYFEKLGIFNKNTIIWEIRHY